MPRKPRPETPPPPTGAIRLGTPNAGDTCQHYVYRKIKSGRREGQPCGKPAIWYVGLNFGSAETGINVCRNCLVFMAKELVDLLGDYD